MRKSYILLVISFFIVFPLVLYFYLTTKSKFVVKSDSTINEKTTNTSHTQFFDFFGYYRSPNIFSSVFQSATVIFNNLLDDLLNPYLPYDLSHEAASFFDQNHFSSQRQAQSQSAQKKTQTKIQKKHPILILPGFAASHLEILYSPYTDDRLLFGGVESAKMLLLDQETAIRHLLVNRGEIEHKVDCECERDPFENEKTADKEETSQKTNRACSPEVKPDGSREKLEGCENQAYEQTSARTKMEYENSRGNFKGFQEKYDTFKEKPKKNSENFKKRMKKQYTDTKIKVRALLNNTNTNSLFNITYIWSELVNRLFQLGYDDLSLAIYPYDWRLSLSELECRDKFFSRIRMMVEMMVKLNKRKAVLLCHSMGGLIGQKLIEPNHHEMINLKKQHENTISQSSLKDIFHPKDHERSAFMKKYHKETLKRLKWILPDWIFKKMSKMTFQNKNFRNNNHLQENKAQKKRTSKRRSKRGKQLSWSEKHIHSLITIGTPHLGTPTILLSLLLGLWPNPNIYNMIFPRQDIVRAMNDWNSIRSLIGKDMDWAMTEKMKNLRRIFDKSNNEYSNKHNTYTKNSDKKIPLVKFSTGEKLYYSDIPYLMNRLRNGPIFELRNFRDREGHTTSSPQQKEEENSSIQQNKKIKETLKFEEKAGTKLSKESTNQQNLVDKNEPKGHPNGHISDELGNDFKKHNEGTNFQTKSSVRANKLKPFIQNEDTPQRPNEINHKKNEEPVTQQTSKENDRRITIYNFYGIGAPTPGAFYLDVDVCEHLKCPVHRQQSDNEKSKNKQIEHLDKTYACCSALSILPNPFLLANFNRTDQIYTKGVYYIDGDGTVPLASLAYQGIFHKHIAKQINMERAQLSRLLKDINKPDGNSASIIQHLNRNTKKINHHMKNIYFYEKFNHVIREYPDTKKYFYSGTIGGPDSARHTNILRNEELIQDVIKILSGEKVEQRVMSGLSEILKNESFDDFVHYSDEKE